MLLCRFDSLHDRIFFSAMFLLLKLIELSMPDLDLK